MLADSLDVTRAGRIDPEILLPAAARYELMGFVAQELPRWRDRPDRPAASSENLLTAQLCSHLNGAVRDSRVWDHVRFSPEAPDEVNPGRRVDMAAQPCGATLVIQGRRHTVFDTLLPVECKRLPTPKERGRDEREYVITEPGTTGGIQRFKFGYHGAAHLVGAMVAYVQDQTLPHWAAQVNRWIQELSAQDGSAWCDSDLLQVLSHESDRGLCTLQSCHRRECGLEECTLRHLWVRMK